LDELRSVVDPWRRSRLADDLAKQLRELTTFALQVRSEALGELVTQGALRTQIAEHLGVSRARVSQLLAPLARKAVA
jgi:DNA-directed RNA polymerase specialized sigma subunit